MSFTRNRLRNCAIAGVCLGIVSPVLAVNRFFPDPSANDDPNSNVVDYNLGTFSEVIVGWEPSDLPDLANAMPFPYTFSQQTTLSVATGGVISPNTFIFNGSTVSIDGGTAGALVTAFDPTTGDEMPSQSGNVVVNSGTVTKGIVAYGNSTVTVNGGSVTDNITGYDSSSVNILGGTVDSATLYMPGAPGGTLTINGGTVTGDVAVIGVNAAGFVSGGTINGSVGAGAENEAISDVGGGFAVSNTAVGGDVYAIGTGVVVMGSGLVSGNAYVRDNALLTLGNVTVLTGAQASNSGQLNLGSSTIAGAVTLNDNSIMTASNGGISIGLTASQSSNATLNGEQILGQVYATDSSVVTLQNCSVTVSAGSTAVQTVNNATANVSGASTIQGDITLAGGTANISGGVVQGNLLSAGGTVNFSGGLIVGAVTIAGGVFNYTGGLIGNSADPYTNVEKTSFELSALQPADTLTDSSLGISVQSGGLLNIYGLDLTTMLVTKNYTGGFSEYALTGTLADGTQLTDDTFLVQNKSGSSFALLPPVPEPASAGLLLGCGCLALRRRKRR